MTFAATVVIGLAALQAGALRIAVRAMADVDLQTLPARLRIRLQWWLRHDRHAYAVCAAAAIAGALTQLAPVLA
jgi:hypothetical protein